MEATILVCETSNRCSEGNTGAGQIRFKTHKEVAVTPMCDDDLHKVKVNI